MDEIHRARLSSTPHPPGNLPLPEPDMQPQTHADDIHINAPAAPVAGGAGQPIPIQLPNIYVNPFPAAEHHHHVPSPEVTGTRHRDGPEINVPTATAPRKRADNSIKLGPWRVAKPHPLLWLYLGLSIVALVLGVPKGSLPTLTGRHKALRAQEKLLSQKAELISQLSHFLPPPLSTLVAPALPSDPTTSLLALNDRGQLEYIHNAGMRFWNSYTGNSVIGAGGEDRWWSVEELGEGASVVRSKSDGREKEVWVLRMGDDRDGHRTLQNALTHSLLVRDRLQTELEKEKSKEKAAPVATIEPASQADNRSTTSSARDAALERQREEALREERARLQDARRREREREKEVEEREVEVARREKWVVDEMRKLSDKVHAQASELTLEDRINERIKAYQRQLIALQTAEREAATVNEAARGHGSGKTEL